ncbi:MAG: tyrosine-type recombinase/integrase [Alphaproteobacteria bacterium]
MALTDFQCKSAKPTNKTQKIFDGGGLYLEVTPAGGKYWKLKYRYLGKEKKLSIGPYPAYTLAEARLKREEYKKIILEGADPCQIKQEEKRQRLFDAENTLKSIAEEWHKHNSEKWSKNHARTVERRLEQDIYPALGKKPITEIKAPDIIHMVKKIEGRGAYEMARRSLQYLRQIYDYAYCHAIVDHNPVNHMKGVLKTSPPKHYASITIEELPVFLRDFKKNEARLFPQTMLAMELMMLTFVRTSELIKATWEEFDLENAVWLIPAKRMKMKKDHVVPLSTRSVEILRDLHRMNGHRRYVFPSKTNPRNPMSNNTILAALRRMGYSGIMTGHGFRSLAMTAIMEKLGYQFEIPDAQLAHSKGGSVRSAYDRTRYLDQRKQMMQDWADYIESLSVSDTKT